LNLLKRILLILLFKYEEDISIRLNVLAR